MENKPIVTCHGDQTLFSKLHPLVIRGLRRETVEWKRSYGRPSRTVCVEATFVPFNPSILPSDDEWTLLGRPFFHTYWTDCDVEGYRTLAKEEIGDWLAALKEKDISDWLIIVVMNEESRVKSRLLRNSVYDKVKNDFCSKMPDRCVTLCEPLKNDAKASESWGIVLAKMRQLLLDSYSRNLGRFEEFMRAQRESRTDVKWSYCAYFLLQEELAFMYEMLGLYEDALVQYDELDALFTQFVLNFSVGDSAPWLVNFSKHPATRWDGLCLSQPINISKREMIKYKEASLLDLRNYLFSRQCTLLFVLSRSWEVGQRAIPFMHNCIKELDILEIKLPDGAIDCWVYLSCLEVLSTCQRVENHDRMEMYSLCTANLWDYARTKISNLGCLCGLMHPGNPASNELHQVVELLSGLVHAEGDSEPVSSLKEALSSKEGFHKRYLELSELAMCSFKHIGRLRSARKVGKDLASFHMMLNEFEKAEGYLHDAVKMFKTEGWEMLADDTRMDIAYCQKATNQTLKYCRTCMYITSSPTLPKETRMQYQRELEMIGLGSSESSLLVRCAPVFYVTNMEPSAKYFTCDKPVTMRLNLLSNLVDSIKVDFVCVSVIYWTTVVDATSVDKGAIRRRSQPSVHVHSRQPSGSDRNIHSREPSGSSVVGIDLYNRIQETIQASSQPLDLHPLVEVKGDEEEASSSAVICRSPLRRLKSIPGATKEKEIIKDGWDLVLTATDQVIEPGRNEIEISALLNSPGCYLVNQLCVKFNGIECYKNLTTDCMTLAVMSNDLRFTLEPVREPLLAGLNQDIRLSLSISPDFYEEGILPLRLAASDGLQLVSECINHDGTLSLPPVINGDQCQMNISAVVPIPDDVPDFICHEVVLSGGNITQAITRQLKFVLPFRITYCLHTAYKRKFVQVVVVGCTDTSLVLSEPVISSVDSRISFISLCNFSQSFVVKLDQNVSFLWEFQTDDLFDAAQLPCVLQFKYNLAGDNVDVERYEQKFCFTLENLKTLFTTSSTLDLKDDTCETGDRLIIGKDYNVKLVVNPVCDEAVRISPLCYEISFNEKEWTVSGETKGNIVFTDGHFEVSVSARPQKCGCLYLPSVRILVVSVSETTSDSNTEVPSSVRPEDKSADDCSSSLGKGDARNPIDSDVVLPKLGAAKLEDSLPPNRPNSEYRLLTENQVYNCTRAQQVYVNSLQQINCN